MEKQRAILFYDLCRLCLNGPGDKDLFSKNLNEDVFFHTGVKISSSDKLPQKICCKCMDVIINIKELKNTAISTDTHLKSLFGWDDDRTNECLTNTIVISNEDSSASLSSETAAKISACSKKIKKLRKKISKEVALLSQNKSLQKPKLLSVRKDLFSESNNNNSSSPENIIQNDEETQKVNGNDRKRTKHVEHTLDDSQSDENENDKSSEQETKQNIRRKMKKIIKEDNKCEVCGKEFETRKKLHLHNRNHNKAYECDTEGCGKKFATRGDLTKHQRVHTGEKPYSCEHCKMSFTQKVSLKLHKEKVHSPSKLQLGDNIPADYVVYMEE